MDTIIYGFALAGDWLHVGPTLAVSVAVNRKVANGKPPETEQTH